MSAEDQIGLISMIKREILRLEKYEDVEAFSYLLALH